MKKYLRCFLILAIGVLTLNFSFKDKPFERDIVIHNFQDTLEVIQTKVYKQNVHASYYSDKLNGRKTASGQIFNNSSK
jgi:rare lipoprotein A (peptidoglycan hydrolase)